ncbi:MAG: HAD-IIB family hydrolase [Acidobacteriota bacterium]
MRILFTDLDGTLLHSHTYSSEPAAPALLLLKQLGIPLIFCTSKTRAEVELWRERLGIDDPFVVENGGAVYVPRGYFSFKVPNSSHRDGYDVIELGTPYAMLVETLRLAAEESGCEVLGFNRMSLADIAIRTQLPVAQAALAKQREFDEPFEVIGTGAYRLLEAIERRGLRWTRGDRFYHITGENTKAQAVRLLASLYLKAAGGKLTTIGAGNAHNDAEFLKACDIPIIIQSRYAAALKKAVPHGIVTASPGPHGWNEGVLGAVSGLPAAKLA